MSKNNKMTGKEKILCIVLIIILSVILAYLSISTWLNPLPESRSNCNEFGNMFGLHDCYGFHFALSSNVF